MAEEATKVWWEVLSFKGLKVFEVLKVFKFFLKTWQEVIDSSASRVRQDIVDSDLVTRLQDNKQRTTYRCTDNIFSSGDTFL